MFVEPSSSVGYALIALTRALPICPYPLLPRTTGCTFNRGHLFPRLFRHADWAGKALHHGAINLKPTAQLRSSIDHVASKFSWNFARNYYFPSVVKTLCFPVFCTQENAISYPLIHAMGSNNLRPGTRIMAKVADFPCIASTSCVVCWLVGPFKHGLAWAVCRIERCHYLFLRAALACLNMCHRYRVLPNVSGSDSGNKILG